jgi:predicted peptidase
MKTTFLKKYFLLISLVVIPLLTVFLVGKIPAQNESPFEKKIFIPKTGDTLLYRLLRPVKSDSSIKYPLVIFLHGAGEREKDNTSQLKRGVMNFATDVNRKMYPCYIVAPQCPPDYRWVEVDWKLPSHIMPKQPSVYLARTMILVDSLVKNLNIDKNRIYITGLSMGGFGVWDAISRWPDKFAAAVPVCGGGDTAKATMIKNIPIWAFHGDKDNLVMTSRSRNMIAAIKKAGGNPKYTEYPATGHNAWDKAYSEKDMYLWLFTQTNANRE